MSVHNQVGYFSPPLINPGSLNLSLLKPINAVTPVVDEPWFFDRPRFFDRMGESRRPKFKKHRPKADVDRMGFSIDPGFSTVWANRGVPNLKNIGRRPMSTVRVFRSTPVLNDLSSEVLNDRLVQSFKRQTRPKF